ncbi:MAG: hypothetical protein DRO06_04195 [Thermoproteota archaeon]|nr:MAG: hypothetical protein DRO06_04195 [Candidatus Korarchaeota archaeon]
MVERADVVVVGAGIIGCATSYYLAQRGLDVVVVEREHVAAGSTGRCPGGIRMQWSTEEHIRLAMKSVEIFEGLSEELGVDTEYRQGGYLIIAKTEEEVRAFEENMRLQRSLGVPVRWLEPSEIREMVPQLDVEGIGALGAAWNPRDGYANPFKVAYGYARAARRMGVRFLLGTEVRRVLVEEGQVRGVETDRGRIRAEYVVNAAGAWSREVAETAGVRLPNRPFRHEILVTEPIERFLEPMVICFHDNVYFRQSEEGTILGGWGDPGERPGYNFRSSLRFLTTFSRLLKRYVPALGHLRVVRQWAGLYDVTPDAKQITGPVEGVDGFIQANGFSGHGFMMGPATSLLVAQLIAGEPLDLPIEPFLLSRFERGEVVGEASVVG